MTDLSWMDQAGCLDVEDVFFPDQHGDPAPALAICAACPVRDECLAWATAERIRFGIMGGQTVTDRKKRWPPPPPPPVPSHCPAGHLYEGPNLLVTKRGDRRCRTCNRESQARRRAAA